MLRVMIADDEAPARRKLERFLADVPDVEIVAQAANGIDAVDLCRLTRPQLLFLDIRMPDLDGIGVAEALLQHKDAPRIVFVTAYDEYAVRAFDVRAVDYLLKPYDRERFTQALHRVRDLSGTRDAAGALHEVRRDSDYPKRLLVPAGDRSVFVPVDNVLRFEADGNYVRVHANGGTYTMRTTLESLERRLDPQHFARIHRAHVVRIAAVISIEPWFRGDYTATLSDGTKLPWSRRYAARRPDILT